jgi:hypothetical protein
MATVAHVKSLMDISNQWSLSVKEGSSATRIIENGPFSILGRDPGQDFGTRVDPNFLL